MNEPVSVITQQDPGFLCRCALTYNWEVLIQFCRTLQETTCEEELVRAMRQFQETDQWGNSPLHAACYNRPPLEVVRAILKTASSLHAQSRTPFDQPETNDTMGEKKRKLPIKLIHLKRARDGSTALQVACACGASVEVIRELLEAPGGAGLVTAADSMGTTPLSDLVVQYTLERKSPPHVRGSFPLQEINTIEEAAPIFRVFWCKVELLLLSAWKEQGMGDFYPSILHGAANVAEGCPDVVIDLICRCFPHLPSFGPDGVLPLHVALDKREDHLTHIKSRERHNYVIHTLIQLYPGAIDRPCVSGRSTMCCAVSSGLCWQMLDGEAGPIKTLWYLTPSKLHERDTQTGLLPFALAAVERPAVSGERDIPRFQGKDEYGRLWVALAAVERPAVSGERDSLRFQGKDEYGRLWVDTIYNLLRLDPLLLGLSRWRKTSSRMKNEKANPKIIK